MKLTILDALTAPLQTRRTSPGWSFAMAIVWLLLGFKAYNFQQDKIVAERLQTPVQTAVQFVSATCRFKSGHNSPVYLHKTYTYQAPADTQSYEVEDMIRYPSMAQCEADLPTAHTITPRYRMVRSNPARKSTMGSGRSVARSDFLVYRNWRPHPAGSWSSWAEAQ